MLLTQKLSDHVDLLHRNCCFYPRGPDRSGFQLHAGTQRPYVVLTGANSPVFYPISTYPNVYHLSTPFLVFKVAPPGAGPPFHCAIFKFTHQVQKGKFVLKPTVNWQGNCLTPNEQLYRLITNALRKLNYFQLSSLRNSLNCFPRTIRTLFSPVLYCPKQMFCLTCRWGIGKHGMEKIPFFEQPAHCRPHLSRSGTCSKPDLSHSKTV